MHNQATLGVSDARIGTIDGSWLSTLTVVSSKLSFYKVGPVAQLPAFMRKQHFPFLELDNGDVSMRRQGNEDLLWPGAWDNRAVVVYPTPWWGLPFATICPAARARWPVDPQKHARVEKHHNSSRMPRVYCARPVTLQGRTRCRRAIETINNQGS